MERIWGESREVAEHGLFQEETSIPEMDRDTYLPGDDGDTG